MIKSKLKLNKKNKKIKLPGDNMSHNLFSAGNRIEPLYSHNLYKFPIEDKNAIKIVDSKSAKHFGILLGTQQAIEEFQAKSGMFRAFTTEYQFHYWALVARIKIDDEVLDIAIPTVIFNYDQKVNGAAVDFHLNDVEKASNDNAEIAGIIAGIIIDSEFGKYLLSRFPGIEWINVPMNTCHVHPGSLSNFSETDYKKDIADPGICFPLSEPKEQASFSSIICHDTSKGHIAKVVHTEYRFANRVENEIQYKHGTCLAYWRDNREVKIPILQSLFTKKENHVKPSYTNINGAVVLDGNVLLNEIIAEFNKFTDWSAHTEDVKAERIVSRVVSHGNYYKNPSYNHTKLRRIEVISKDDEEDNVYNMSLYELKQALLKLGIGYLAVNEYGLYEARCKYMEFMEPTSTSTKLTIPAKNAIVAAESNHRLEVKHQTNDITIDEMIKYLLDIGYQPDEIKGKSFAEINFIMFEEEFENMIDFTQQEVEITTESGVITI